MRGKVYGVAFLTAALITFSAARLPATALPAGYGDGSEDDPWLFESNYYSAFYSSSSPVGYVFNNTSGYYETGSSVDVSGYSVYVGYSHTIGRLTIDGGYTVTDANGYIGYNSGIGGTVLVTGSGSTWANTGKLYIGYEGTGELDVEDSGAVTSNYIYIGGVGTLNTTGTGVGTLNITSGSVSSAYCFVGAQSGKSGAVTVNGSSASFSTTSQLIIGSCCTGSLTIENGGTVTSSGAATLGNNSGVTGTALVTGSGSTWKCTSSAITVGYTGTGILNIEDSGAVTTAALEIGYYDGASGTVTVTGEDSKLTLANSESSVLCVGYEGTGVLNIEDGASVTCDAYCYLGGYTASGTTGSGTVSVTGSGSSFSSYNSTYVGYNGKGALNVTSGGTAVIGNECYIGYNSGTSGTVTVSGSSGGTASSLTAKGGFFVGYQSSGTLNVLNGGHVISEYDTIIGYYTGTGTVLVSGSGSKLSVSSGTLYVGLDSDSSSGTLTIEDGGLVVTTGFSLCTGHGTLYIGGGYLAISGTSVVSTIEGYITAGDVYLVDASGTYVKVTDTNSSLLGLYYFTSSSESAAAAALYAKLGLDDSTAYTILTSTYNVPEPSTWALFGGMSALGTALCVRRRRV